MKKLILSLFFCSYLPAEILLQGKRAAEIQESHFYTDFGLTFQAPTIGVGWRNRYHYFGVDCSLKISAMLPLPLPIAGRGSCSALYYLNSNMDSEFYGGVGISGMLPVFGFFNTVKSSFVGPVFILGNSYKNKNLDTRFWQVSLELYPNQKIKYEKIKDEIKSIISFSYGICF